MELELFLTMNNFTDYKQLIKISLDVIDETKLLNIIYVLNSIGIENKAIICGNGGSFANAQHFAQDLQKMCGITAVALGSNPSYLTAVSNDSKYSKVFVNELANIVTQGDVVIILSCSGDSKNVIKVAKYMNSNDWGYTIALTGGFTNTKIERHADTTLKVLSKDYGIIEGVHSILCHYIVKELKEKIEKSIQ